MKNLLTIIVLTLIFFACNSNQTKNSATIATEPDTIQTVLNVVGMSCDHCEMTIQESLTPLSGVISIVANHEDSTATITYDASKISIDNISATIEKKGYKVKGEKK